MKNKILTMMIVLLGFGCAPVTHTHSYGSWRESTFMEDLFAWGAIPTKTRTCKGCGADQVKNQHLYYKDKQDGGV